MLADGVYALTAEGDPNIGAIEGEDFLVCFEALATPVAARSGWTGCASTPTSRSATWCCRHYHAVRVLGRVRVRRRGDRRPREHPGAGRRAGQAGLGERVRPDAAAGRGRRLGPRADLAHAHLLRPADHRPRRRPRRPGAAVLRPRAHRGRHRRLAAAAADPVRRRPGRGRGRALHRRRVPPRLGRPAPSTGCRRSAPRARRRPRRGQPGPRRGRRGDRADPRLPAA